MSLIYIETTKFTRQFNKLLKKYRSLRDDLEVSKKGAIKLLHVSGIDNRSCFKIYECPDNNYCIYKLKKFACKSLQGKGVMSGIRIIYAHFPKENKIEFIEIYYKEDQTVEDKNLIRCYIEDHIRKIV